MHVLIEAGSVKTGTTINTAQRVNRDSRGVGVEVWGRDKKDEEWKNYAVR